MMQCRLKLLVVFVFGLLCFSCIEKKSDRCFCANDIQKIVADKQAEDTIISVVEGVVELSYCELLVLLESATIDINRKYLLKNYQTVYRAANNNFDYYGLDKNKYIKNNPQSWVGTTDLVGWDGKKHISDYYDILLTPVSNCEFDIEAKIVAVRSAKNDRTPEYAWDCKQWKIHYSPYNKKATKEVQRLRNDASYRVVAPTGAVTMRRSFAYSDREHLKVYKEFECSENLFDKEVYTIGRYLSSTGERVVNLLWAISDPITVTEGAIYISTGYFNAGDEPSVCFYDASSQFISGVKNGYSREKWLPEYGTSTGVITRMYNPVLNWDFPYDVFNCKWIKSYDVIRRMYGIEDKDFDVSDTRQEIYFYTFSVGKFNDINIPIKRNNFVKGGISNVVIEGSNQTYYGQPKLNNYNNREVLKSEGGYFNSPSKDLGGYGYSFYNGQGNVYLVLLGDIDGNTGFLSEIRHMPSSYDNTFVYRDALGVCKLTMGSITRFNFIRSWHISRVTIGDHSESNEMYGILTERPRFYQSIEIGEWSYRNVIKSLGLGGVGNIYIEGNDNQLEASALNSVHLEETSHLSIQCKDPNSRVYNLRAESSAFCSFDANSIVDVSLTTTKNLSITTESNLRRLSANNTQHTRLNADSSICDINLQGVLFFALNAEGMLKSISMNNTNYFHPDGEDMPEINEYNIDGDVVDFSTIGLIPKELDVDGDISNLTIINSTKIDSDAVVNAAYINNKSIN